jgi:peptide/nickel transport system substrate-binding protein
VSGSRGSTARTVPLPADGASVPGDATLSWTAQPFAASYDIEVYKNGDMIPNLANRVVNATTQRVSYVLDTLDPAQNSVNESIWLDQNLYSRLLQPNATGTGLLPDLATSWDISNGAKKYTFHLQPDALFSDGSPVTAQDVAYSLNRSKNTSGGWGFLLTAVKKISATDAHTVVITLTQPHAPLLADLAMYAYSIIPEKLVKAQGKAFFQHPVSSGPFMVTSFSADSEIDLAANPHYYGKKPNISTVKIMIVPNDNTRVLELESKKVDVIENPPDSRTVNKDCVA